ncbi:MAG: lytic murein transglycosylase B [Burkholderiaceae bacterium]|jgi:membrane-bound lytic murein transglycosylase B|nr:lytic murein transglycosylase B [Burkholderiaceae bacterium]
MRRRTFSAALLLAASVPAKAAAARVFYAGREDAMRFADELAGRQNLPLAWVRQAIGQARFDPQAQRLMRPAASGFVKNWALYRGRFIDAAHIGAAVDFWRTHRATLARAQDQYGAPPEIIVGILGVETLYGRHMGRFRVLDALATHAFDFPPEHPQYARRQSYFVSELASFLSLCHANGLAPTQPLGSYAGAMGMPQFMPSSLLRYAVDYDGDGRIDLAASTADAIGSVACYLQAHGWIPGLPTHYPARLAPDADLPALLAPGIAPAFTPAQLATRGATLPEDGARHPGVLALIELQNGDPQQPGNAPPAYIAGTQNFYVITRYNQSSYYAMAVIELGQTAAAIAAHNARHGE